MRAPVLVLLGLVIAAIGLLLAALAGAITDEMVAGVVFAAGAVLLLSRRQLAAWANSVGENVRLLRYWRELRPLGVTLFATGLMILSALTFSGALQR